MVKRAGAKRFCSPLSLQEEEESCERGSLKGNTQRSKERESDKEEPIHVAATDERIVATKICGGLRRK